MNSFASRLRHLMEMLQQEMKRLGFVKFSSSAFVKRINEETMGSVGFAASGRGTGFPRIRPSVSVANERILQVRKWIRHETKHPVGSKDLPTDVTIRLEYLLPDEDLKRPFISAVGPQYHEWVLDDRSESVIVAHIVSGIEQFGIPWMEELADAESIYQLIYARISGKSKSRCVFNLMSTMAILLFVTGRTEEAESYAKNTLETVRTSKFGDDYKTYWSAVQNNLLELIRTDGLIN